MVNPRPWYSRAVAATAGYAGHTVRWLPGLAAAACFVTAGLLVHVALGLVVAGVFCLLADWRLR